MTQEAASETISWTEDGVPVSTVFDDVYYSKQDGFAESQYVFIEGLGDDIWQKPDIRLAETGFGTGLNLLACLDYLDRVHPEAHLTYYSVEAHPLRVDQLRQAHRSWPQLHAYSEMFCRSLPYRPLGQGWHILDLSPRRRVVLLIGDVVSQYQTVSGVMDGWFLDGFSPQKNPEMWRPEVFQEIARLSVSGTKLSTFTAAGFVRRGLDDAGFDMQKRAGFGHKRECLVGTRRADPYPRRTKQHPWSMLPNEETRAISATAEEEIVILGAGVSGASLAYQLRQLGKDPLVIDQAPAPAQGASGNPIGLVMPRYVLGDMPEKELYETAFSYATQFMKNFNLPVEKQIISLAETEKDQKRYQRYSQTERAKELGVTFLSVDQLQQQEGINHPFGALSCADGVSVQPWRFVHALLEKGRCQFSVKVASYRQAENGIWQLFDEDGHLLKTCRHLIIATGAAIGAFGVDKLADLDGIKGQVSVVNAPEFEPQKAWVQGSYVTHRVEGEICFGATFDHLSAEELTKFNQQEIAQFAPSENEHHRNMASIQAYAAEDVKKQAITRGRASVRMATKDHLPIVGPLVDRSHFLSLYDGIRHGKKYRYRPFEDQVMKNLWVSGCYGARGLVLAPYLGLYLAYLITGKQPPISIRQIEALHPARFMVRDLAHNVI